MNPSEKSNSINKDNKNDVNEIKNDNLSLEDENVKQLLEENKYVFGWGQYSEITNGRFAMIGFAAIILIEIISNKSFLYWAGLIH